MFWTVAGFLYVADLNPFQGIEDKAFFPIIADKTAVDDFPLRKAYADVYADIDDNANKNLKGENKPEATTRKSFLDYYTRKPATPESDGDGDGEEPPSKPLSKGQDSIQRLAEEQAKWNEASLDRNKATARSDSENHLEEAKQWLTGKIKMLESDIKQLEKELGGESGKLMPIQVVDEKGVAITDEERSAGPELVGRPVTRQASEWTRISCKASRSSEFKESFTSEQASVIAAKVDFGLVSASGGVGHTNSSAKAMSSMANLDVEITMDTMVVEIDRPWLHEDLFYDAELDSGKFDISPGPAELKRFYEQNETPSGPHQQFSSYPTAFVVAPDVELSTKMESTATGCKISIQAPQIVAWVETLMPQLPKPKNGDSSMVGLFDKRTQQPKDIGGWWPIN
ncbi:hypothetical protein PG984_014033 [Apiospora sp. TS-2023a]